MAVEQITLASVNTHFARALRTAGGLGEAATADILLLQELYDVQPSDKTALINLGFSVISLQAHSGLGIAYREKSHVHPTEDVVRDRVLQPAGRFGIWGAQRFADRPLDYTDHGILAAKFMSKGGSKFTVAVVHAPVVTSPFRRRHFLRNLSNELTDPYYSEQLILAGDMNHYPQQHRIDRVFQERAGLSLVRLAAPTWPSRYAGWLERFIGACRPGTLDDVMYRGHGLSAQKGDTYDLQSDHRAILATFHLTT
jgi:endonuclease/exonuclease/phosphatase family metal-dependent hydrolase